MTIKKPGISPPAASLPFDARNGFDQLRQCLEIIMGRRAGKDARLNPLSATDLTVAPTAADYNALLADVRAIHDKVNNLIERLQD